MLNKTSDIVINTKEDAMEYCTFCKSYVKKSDFNYDLKCCKNCKKDIENDTKNSFTKP
jgi:acetyl-CoA carboxylase beta subunit